LIDGDTEEDLAIIEGSDRRTRRDKAGNTATIGAFLCTLSGQQCCTGMILNDPEDGLPKLFFVFQDLSVRVLGTYRLKCHVVDMKK
jgi:hypothetical protein